MEEADFVYGFYGSQDLVPETECCGEAEGAPGLRPPELRQVLRLQLHHHVVEALVAAAPDEAAGVLAPWGEREGREGGNTEVTGFRIYSKFIPIDRIF